MYPMLAGNTSTLPYELREVCEQHEDEKLVFSEAIRSALANSGSVSRKAILFYLVTELGHTREVVRIDILRNCLEMLMGMKEETD